MTAVIMQSEFWEIWNRKIEYFAVENVHRNNGLAVCMMSFGALSMVKPMREHGGQCQEREWEG